MFGLDVLELVKVAGYFGLFAIVFAESGLLIGFFLPGDSLLFTAGILASQGYLNVWALVSLLIVAAIAGDSAGYWFGKKVGLKLFTRQDSLFFSQKNVRRAEAFFEKYGKTALIIARFTPVVRTLVPMLAGVGSMNYRTFFAYNVIGALVWVLSVTLMGYYLTPLIPGIEHYVAQIAVVIIIVSILPSVKRVWNDPESRAKILDFIRRRGERQ